MTMNVLLGFEKQLKEAVQECNKTAVKPKEQKIHLNQKCCTYIYKKRTFSPLRTAQLKINDKDKCFCQ